MPKTAAKKKQYKLAEDVDEVLSKVNKLRDEMRRKAEEEAKKEQIASMDESQLLRAAVPLRKYLESNVMAVVRRGLIECAEVRPNDPIDYLAEFLLENNHCIE